MGTKKLFNLFVGCFLAMVLVMPLRANADGPAVIKGNVTIGETVKIISEDTIIQGNVEIEDTPYGQLTINNGCSLEITGNLVNIGKVILGSGSADSGNYASLTVDGEFTNYAELTVNKYADIVVKGEFETCGRVSIDKYANVQFDKNFTASSGSLFFEFAEESTLTLGGNFINTDGAVCGKNGKPGKVIFTSGKDHTITALDSAKWGKFECDSNKTIYVDEYLPVTELGTDAVFTALHSDKSIKIGELNLNTHDCTINGNAAISGYGTITIGKTASTNSTVSTGSSKLYVTGDFVMGDGKINLYGCNSTTITTQLLVDGNLFIGKAGDENESEAGQAKFEKAYGIVTVGRNLYVNNKLNKNSTFSGTNGGRVEIGGDLIDITGNFNAYQSNPCPVIFMLKNSSEHRLVTQNTTYLGNVSCDEDGQVLVVDGYFNIGTLASDVEVQAADTDNPIYIMSLATGENNCKITGDVEIVGTNGIEVGIATRPYSPITPNSSTLDISGSLKLGDGIIKVYANGYNKTYENTMKIGKNLEVVKYDADGKISETQSQGKLDAVNGNMFIGGDLLINTAYNRVNVIGGAETATTYIAGGIYDYSGTLNAAGGHIKFTDNDLDGIHIIECADTSYLGIIECESGGSLKVTDSIAFTGLASDVDIYADGENIKTASIETSSYTCTVHGDLIVNGSAVECGTTEGGGELDVDGNFVLQNGYVKAYKDATIHTTGDFRIKESDEGGCYAYLKDFSGKLIVDNSFYIDTNTASSVLEDSEIDIYGNVYDESAAIRNFKGAMKFTQGSHDIYASSVSDKTTELPNIISDNATINWKNETVPMRMKSVSSKMTVNGNIISDDIFIANDDANITFNDNLIVGGGKFRINKATVNAKKDLIVRMPDGEGGYTTTLAFIEYGDDDSTLNIDGNLEIQSDNNQSFSKGTLTLKGNLKLYTDDDADGIFYAYPGHTTILPGISNGKQTIDFGETESTFGTLKLLKQQIKYEFIPDRCWMALYAPEGPEEYTITYETYGGSNSEANPGTYNEDTEEFELEAAAKEGYRFKGWFTDDEFENAITEISGELEKNITLYAKWEEIEYTISYELNGGTNAAENPTKYTINSPTIVWKAPTRAGYTFIGWYLDPGFKIPVKNLGSGSTNNLKLYARWQQNPPAITEYSISYVLNGGKNHKSNPSSYTENSTTIKLQKPTKTGYSFAGWYTDSKFKKKITQIAPGSKGDIVVYAKWKANTYTIKFNANGGKGKKIANVKMTYDKSVKLKACKLTKEGYKFAGWATSKKNAKKGTVAYKNKAKVKNLTAKNKGTVTLYAVWKKKK